MASSRGLSWGCRPCGATSASITETVVGVRYFSRISRSRTSAAGGLPGSRRIVVGESDAANGWTDGSTYIAINRDYLKARDFTFQDVIEVATLVLHERCHDCNDTTDHDHGHEFYQLFHDLSRDKLGKAVQAMWRRLPLSLQTESRKLGRAGLKDADNIVRSRQALEESLARLVKKEKELCVSKP